MTSRQALNNIKNLFIGSPINLAQQFEIIEKDLDRLEKLEKENKELNDFKYMFINCKKLTPLPKIPELEKYNKNAKKHHKDLEILDILKKHYDNNSLALSLNSFIVFTIHKNDKDFNKIKEWLENE